MIAERKSMVYPACFLLLDFEERSTFHSYWITGTYEKECGVFSHHFCSSLTEFALGSRSMIAERKSMVYPACILLLDFEERSTFHSYWITGTREKPAKKPAAKGIGKKVAPTTSSIAKKPTAAAKSVNFEKRLNSFDSNVLIKYRPEDAAAKKETRMQFAQADKNGASIESKKPIVVKFGLNPATSLSEQVANTAQLELRAELVAEQQKVHALEERLKAANDQAAELAHALRHLLRERAASAPVQVLAWRNLNEFEYIGGGACGKIYAAELSPQNQGQSARDVVVKFFTNLKDFLDELEAFRNAGVHRHLAELVGVVHHPAIEPEKMMQQQQADFAKERRRRQQQQADLIATMTGQIATLTAEVAASKDASSSSSSTPAATKKKGAEAELERRKRLSYVPEDLDNPFPSRPKNLDSGMPQLFAMYGDKSYDSLSKKTASSMKYEYIVLAPALSYFHDFLKYTSATVTGFETFETDELYDRLVRLENSIHGVYTLLCNRFTVLQLRASLDGEGASKSDADSLRAKLKFVEDCVYQSSEGLVTDSLLKEYLDEFDKGKHKAAMYANMKLAALVETGNTRGGGRGADGCWRDEKKEQSPAGGKGKGKGRGKASHRATPGLMPRDIWLDKEIERALGTGAWKRASRRQHVSRVFLVKKPGVNKWRLVVDF
ncbi:protein kinase domain-containing protein [Cymbomonas tetramitiformis]|uniref:Protein kinase domain-containing protein n=1 Tax=Cymbomonas tetramitiformis TaxID=36881 RepID=A0AAE0G8R8_9CHLO|nr:protein kinase domain-containing protein [Cymbomonas tetramitiformis]